jgi:peptidoglycan/xylan/chitin deacetylase (PgdA/CDA1 family)
MLGWFLPYIFLGAAQRRLMTRGVPIFAWHKIGAPPPATSDPFLYAAPRVLDNQLQTLARAGFAGAPLPEALTGQPSPGRKAVVTFDDGFADVLENGLPILSKHKCKAIQFLVAGRLGGRNEWDVAKGDVPAPLMDAAQVKDWLAAGMEIGSHSLTHRNLPRLDLASALEEIAGSKKALEDRFGLEIKHFCYPYGSWNESVRGLVAEAGYATACTLRFGVNSPSTPALELRRIYPLSSRELLAKIRHRLGRTGHTSRS